MKIAILAAGNSSKYFPLFIDKPKCLYHMNGTIQLEKVIENAKSVVEEKDIILVIGYKYWFIEEFMKQNYPNIEIRINHSYNKAAIFTFRKAIENINDDVVFMFGDETISRENLLRIASSDRKLSILYHDTFYYYSLGIFKLRADCLNILQDDKYLDMEKMKEIYCFANQKDIYDGVFDINSGICIGYMMIDFVRRIGKINKIENPGMSYFGSDIDFLHYNPELEYIPDLDYISDTDEYKKSILLKIYCKCFSNPVKMIMRYIKR